MAKEKAEKESEILDPKLKAEQKANAVFKEIEKEYGSGSIVFPETILEEPTKVISWSPSVDLILSGGVPEGSWVSVNGKYKSGKSTSVLSFAANCQREENGCKNVYYLDVEGRLKKMNLTGIKGLILDKPRLNIIRSTEERILSAQDYLIIAEKILKSCPRCVLIIDSISALADKKEQDGGVGTETRGHGAKVLAQFINNMANVVTVTKSIIVGITQIYANTSGYGAAMVEKACNRWLFQADVRLKVKTFEFWKANENSPPFGQIITWECLAAALGPPMMSTDSYLRYGVGIDKTYETIKLACSSGLIDEKGAGWHEITFLAKYPDLVKDTSYNDGKPVKIQGANNVCEIFNKYPKWLDVLNSEVKKLTI